MTLRYCIKCHKIVDDPDTFAQGDTVFHNTCRYSLLYFGAEPVKLSPKHILDQYDVSHNNSPIENFTGNAYITNTSNSLTLAIVECKDMLKHQPENVEALLHLLKLHRTQHNSTEFISTAKTLLKLKPAHEETNLLLAQHYRSIKDNLVATAHIDTVLKNNPLNTIALELQGFLQLENKDLESSYKSFMELHPLLKREDDKARIRQVIRNLQTEIDTQLKR